MIDLFNINQYQIDTSKFSNMQHDSIVQEFESTFSDFIGGKYALACSSGTTALHLANKGLKIT